jgi:hypothetical protein
MELNISTKFDSQHQIEVSEIIYCQNNTLIIQKKNTVLLLKPIEGVY